MPIPIIDLFAGPGGMGEGFSSLAGNRFQLSVSIEKDSQAHETLRLRSAFRELKRQGVGPHVWERWFGIIEQTPWQQVFESLKMSGLPEIQQACSFAAHEAWNLEMAVNNRREVIAGIRERLVAAGFSQQPEHCLVIGGPPCQAYSMVGRSRNKGKADYRPEGDHRHFLYLEYLNVLKEFQPVAFVMENVKGILTSKVEGKGIFEAVRRDLLNPSMALTGTPGPNYRLIALSADGLLCEHPQATDFIIQAEDHGVPQMRHRVILLGVREDLFLPDARELRLKRQDPVTVADAIENMPRLRSSVSRRSRDQEWHEVFSSDFANEAIAELGESDVRWGQRLAHHMRQFQRQVMKSASLPSGGERVRANLEKTEETSPSVRAFHKWVQGGPRAPFVSNHETRSHRADDLVRYLFVALFGQLDQESPRLHDFPRALLPNHANIDPDNPDAAIFKDRFRVQLANRPATTVTSHIAKDGHYFIHYDPAQCRSLTVREAARLQSFPDNYIFLGNRTSQYTQVGNAVPPLLARQIAEVVDKVLSFNGL